MPASSSARPSASARPAPAAHAPTRPTTAAGHTAEGFDYTGCRGQAEAEAESVAYIVTAWAGLDAGAYTVPYVAAWSAGDVDAIRAAATTVTAAARRILDALDRAADTTPDPAGDGAAALPGASVTPAEGAHARPPAERQDAT